MDGVDYAWSYRHGWVVWGKGFKVVSLSVSLHPKRTRELILDFTLKVSEGDGAPSDARVLEALAAGMRSAREAGWDPESRGRAFRHSRSRRPPPGGGHENEGDVYRRLQKRSTSCRSVTRDRCRASSCGS